MRFNKLKAIFTAKAPGKLIISGEHAVVYGSPAIVLAVNQYTKTTVALTKNTNNNLPSDNSFTPWVNFNLYNIKYFKAHPLTKLYLLKKQLQNNYIKFLNGKCSIKQVIKKPFELLQYLVTNLIEKLHLQLSENLEIQINSTIPIGSGLGSSAACIISCVHSLVNLFKIDWEPKKFLSIANDIENLQHGKSSGIDLYTTMFGGCNYFPANFNNFNTIEHIILTNFDLKIINTGSPIASTGECVATVKKHFVNTNLIKEFTQTTLAIKKSLLQGNNLEYLEAIRYNHHLLCRIGVVPEKIQGFIKEIEKAGGAAKICGAGSVRGNNAGILLLVGNSVKINNIIAAYGYNIENLTIDYNGVSLV